MATRKPAAAKRPKLVLLDDNGEKDLVFMEPPEKQQTHNRSWAAILQPLVENPNRWARILVMDSVSQAQRAQSNLQQRKVKVPYPDHEWVFAARGCELFAIYHAERKPIHGPSRAKSKR
jgi:hypothetical protein